jgi:hypothetical protein
MSVFKAYDVRGVYGTQIDEKLGAAIGRAFVGITGARRSWWVATCGRVPREWRRRSSKERDQPVRMSSTSGSARRP